MAAQAISSETMAIRPEMASSQRSIIFITLTSIYHYESFSPQPIRVRHGAKPGPMPFEPRHSRAGGNPGNTAETISDNGSSGRSELLEVIKFLI